MEVTDIGEIDWKKLIEEETGVGGFRKSQSNVFYASQILFCRRKKRYSDDGIPPVERFDDSWRARQIGILVHKGMEDVLLRRGYKVEQKARKQIGEYIVSGRADAINDKHVVEIKYKGSNRYTKVSTWDATQLGVYMNLFDRKVGYLVYISENEITWHRHTLPLEDEVILGYIKNYGSPRFVWECKNCGYVDRCPLWR